MVPSYHHHDDQPPAVADNTQPQSHSPRPGSSAYLLQAILTAAEHKQYEKALSLTTRRGGQDLEIVNARGVCLMRLGKYNEAVVLFRNLVLQPGCVWTRKDRPPHYKCNFATALLLSGRPAGCLEILHELGDDAPPVAAALRSTIKQWESSLSLPAWLAWKFYGSVPSTQPVSIDFEPGDFGNVDSLAANRPGEAVAPPPRNAA